MEIDGFEVIRISLPLVEPFRAAHGVVKERQSLLVRVRTDVGEGWGECPAFQAPTYTHEYVDAAADVLTQHLLPALVGRTVDAPGAVEVLAGFRGHGLARAGVELAILDAHLRHEGRSLASWLGATRTSVECGVAVGVADTTASLVGNVGDLLGQGYRRVKLKIMPGWDQEPVTAVRAAFGDDLVLQVDANGAYRPDQVDALKRIDDCGLALIEQPFPPDALLAHVDARKALRTPIGLDETVTSPQVAADVIRLKAASVLSVKPGMVGGWHAAAEVHRVAQDAGVDLFCGGMLESGIGRAANVALAALPGFTLPGDLSPSRRWFADDLTAGLEMRDGLIPVPTGPGLGVLPDDDALARFSLSSARIE